MSRVIWLIVSKKPKITTSRLVRSALQSLCKMRGEMDEINLSEGEVDDEFIGDWFILHELCESCRSG